MLPVQRYMQWILLWLQVRIPMCRRLRQQSHRPHLPADGGAEQGSLRCSNSRLDSLPYFCTNCQPSRSCDSNSCTNVCAQFEFEAYFCANVWR